jgi:hypothetical protein
MRRWRGVKVISRGLGEMINISGKGAARPPVASLLVTSANGLVWTGTLSGTSLMNSGFSILSCSSSSTSPSGAVGVTPEGVRDESKARASLISEANIYIRKVDQNN